MGVFAGFEGEGDAGFVAVSYAISTGVLMQWSVWTYGLCSVVISLPQALKPFSRRRELNALRPAAMIP